MALPSPVCGISSARSCVRAEFDHPRSCDSYRRRRLRPPAQRPVPKLSPETWAAASCAPRALDRECGQLLQALRHNVIPRCIKAGTRALLRVRRDVRV